MVEIKNKADCTGCHACKSVCPKGCIEMIEDEQGFRYPHVDIAKCVKCGLCEQVCHMKKMEMTTNPIAAYAAKNKNTEQRMNSSSGGVFVVAAECVISQGGSVYGAAFNDRYEVEHIRVTEISEIKRLQTSKYVQSMIGNTYLEVKQDLESGRLVLFTGTPCQIGGLRSFLRRDYDNLYCQDIMCHGVPSPKVWKKYIDELGAGRINYINFRDKTDGWSRYHVKIDGEKRCVYDVFNKNTYMRAFLADASLRPSCYNCHYKHLHYLGDYTIADFWGVSEVCPEINDDKGVSLLIVNTDRGKKLFESMKHDLDVKQVKMDQVSNGNGAAISGAAMNEKNIALFSNLDSMTLHKIVEKYIRGSIFRRIMNKLKR